MVLIGKEGDALASLQTKSAGLSNIRFLINIPREDTVAAYHAADVFLFGSHIEASPLVIIEAKASKTPFVSTDCGNVKEWKGGIVCLPEEMAGNANRILDDESVRNQLAEEGYREWKEKLTWEAVVDKYEELYTRLHHSKRKQVTVPQPMTEYDEKQFSERLQKNFKDVPTLIRLAEIELQRSNQKKAKNYLIAALAIEPQNVAAKTLLEKLQ